MDQCSSHLDKRIASLENAIRGLEARLGALEGNSPAQAPKATLEVERYEPSTPLRSSLGLGLADMGRGFLVMAGAFMLRALTNSEILPPRIGIALGLIFSLFWIFMAGRSGVARMAHTSLYGSLSALIAGEATFFLYIRSGLFALHADVDLSGLPFLTDFNQ